MEKTIKNFIISNNNEKIKGTNTFIYSLNSLDGDYLGIMTFKDNILPETDDELLECCLWKAAETMSWKYGFEGFKNYGRKNNN